MASAAESERAIPSRSTRSSDRSISSKVQSVSAAGVGDTAVMLDGSMSETHEACAEAEESQNRCHAIGLAEF